MRVNKTKFERAKFEKFTRSYRPVGIELNSIQAIEVDSVVRVVSDRPGSVSILSPRDNWDDRNDPDGHMETRLIPPMR